jgi:hypothetical protein
LLNKRVKDEMVRVLQKEYLRRSLIEYFGNKGYEKTFNICAYPPSLMDLSEQPFSNKSIEVAFNIEDIDLVDNSVKVAWNVFVLGNKRIFLGYTNHQNFTDIKNSKNTIKDYNGPITINKIIEFIIEFLGNSNQIFDINRKPTNNSFVNKPLISKY